MRIAFALMLLAVPVFAQQTASVILCSPVDGVKPAIDAVIADQGADVIKATTGQAPKKATLASLILKNCSTTDKPISGASVYAAVELNLKVSIMSSDVVDLWLDVFQQKDIYSRLFKGAIASTNIAAILTTAFKGSPQLATSLQFGVDLYRAIIPVVHDPRDLRDLSRKIMPINSPLILGRESSGNESHAGLVVVMAPSIEVSRVIIQ